jgi:hypothetical protein
MEADRFAWLERLTHACDHAITQLEHRGDPLLQPLIEDLRALRLRLQTEPDGDAD